jgi:hypothetical protein
MWVSRADARRIPDDERSEEERRMGVRRWIDFPSSILSAPNARRARRGDIYLYTRFIAFFFAFSMPSD